MSDREPESLALPDRWQDIQPDFVDRSVEGRLVSFSKTQIRLGILYNSQGYSGQNFANAVQQVVAG